MSPPPCVPWCKAPPSTFPGAWVCPVCGSRWYVEPHVEALITWARVHVEPPLTEDQLAFLRAYLCGKR